MSPEQIRSGEVDGRADLYSLGMRWFLVQTGGDPSFEFPWGDWDSNRANTFESGLSRTTAVGLYPKGASLVGALDMAGNVREWCLNEFEEPKKTNLSSTPAG